MNLDNLQLRYQHAFDFDHLPRLLDEHDFGHDLDGLEGEDDSGHEAEYLSRSQELQLRCQFIHYDRQNTFENRALCGPIFDHFLEWLTR